MNELDSLRWFSQRRIQTQILIGRCVWCGVLSDRVALFTFCLMRHDSPKRHIFGGCALMRGAMTPELELSWDFCTVHLLQVSSSYIYSFGSYRVDKPTNKQTPPKTSNALRYGTTLGNNLSGLLHYLGKLNYLHGHIPGDIIGTAIDQWRKRLLACICANGGHFEHLFWTNSCKQFAFSLVFGSTGCKIFTVLMLDAWWSIGLCCLTAKLLPC